MYPRNELMLPPLEFWQDHLDDVRAQAEQHRRLREAGLLGNRWLACQVCRSLWRLGHLLVMTGLRLERRYALSGLRSAV